MGLPLSSLSLVISITVSAPGTMSQLIGLFAAGASSFRLGEATGLRVLALLAEADAGAAGAGDFGAGVADGIFVGG